MKLSYLILLFSSISFSLSSQKKNADYDSPYKICSLGSYEFEGLKGKGSIQDDLSLSKEFEDISEKNALWLDWKVLSSGTFKFKITPNNPSDDFDFVLYKMTDLKSSIRRPIRIMMSGQNLSEGKESRNCLGITGLSGNASDDREYSGCEAASDNFLAPVVSNQNDHYILLINSYKKTSSFNFAISGDLQLNDKNCLVDNRSNSNNIVLVYPNPTTDKLTIEYQLEKVEQSEIIILDVAGKLMYSSKNVQLEQKGKLIINSIPFTPGQYFVRLKNGNEVIDVKFLKI